MVQTSMEFPDIYIMSPISKRIDFIVSIPESELVKSVALTFLTALNRLSIEEKQLLNNEQLRAEFKNKLWLTLTPVVGRQITELSTNLEHNSEYNELVMRAIDALHPGNSNVLEGQQKLLTDAIFDSQAITKSLLNLDTTGLHLTEFYRLLNRPELPFEVKVEISKVFERNKILIERKVKFLSLLTLVESLELTHEKGRYPIYQKIDDGTGRISITFETESNKPFDIANIQNLGLVRVKALMELLGEIDQIGTYHLTYKETNEKRHLLLGTLAREVDRLNYIKVDKRRSNRSREENSSWVNSEQHDFLSEITDFVKSFKLERIVKGKLVQYEVAVETLAHFNYIKVIGLVITRL